jgi:putative (di)nucleoside polyphosphate hydrolase
MKNKTSFRRGVCGIFVSADGMLLLGERSQENGQWQLPQGGIEKNETPLDALDREMEEELGLTDFTVLKDTGEYISYTWPRELQKGGKHHGQQHIYFLIDGADVDIQKLESTEEFSNFGWFTVEETLQKIVSWKAPVYRQAFQKLGLLKD